MTENGSSQFQAFSQIVGNVVCVAFKSSFNGMIYGKDLSLRVGEEPEWKGFSFSLMPPKKAMAERSLKLEHLNLSQAKWKETLCAKPVLTCLLNE